MQTVFFPDVRNYWESLSAGLNSKPNENTSDIPKTYLQ